MLILGLTISADAQTWTDEATGVLVAQPGTITANGVGSPSVVWDPVAERYVMFFETRTGPATVGDCAGGTWSIGIASSDDGLAWDVWPDAVVAPTANTPWRCVAAHPTAVYDGGVYHLWFKAEQGVVPAACGNAWGCNNYSGIAHATVDVDLDDKTTEIAVVQAQIAAVLADQPPLAALGTALQDYELDLRSTNEFDCADPVVPGLCAPCTQVTLASTPTNADSQTFCQPFEFAIAATVTIATGGTGNDVVRLAINPVGGGQINCRYDKSGNDYSLDSTPNPKAQDGVCLNGMTAGTLVQAASVRLFIDDGGSGNSPTVTAPLTATNPQAPTSGALLTSIDDLEAAIALDDGQTTLSLLPAFQTSLQSLLNWLAPSTPLDAGKTQLEADGQALLNQANQLEADLAAWDAVLQPLQAELAALLAYTQSVDVVSLLSQVGVRINRTFGYPVAMKQGSTWVMMFQDYPNVWRGTSASPDGPFVIDALPVMTAGTVSWANTEVYDPNLLCSGDPTYPYETWFGGRTVTLGTFTSGGISDGYSADAATWVLNTASQLFGWTNVNDYRHLDVLRSSDGEHRMWYTSKVGGAVQVNVASTGAFDDTLSTQRVCP